MVILICPGIHPVGETDDFVAGLRHANQLSAQDQVWIYPAHQQPAFSAPHIFQFLDNRIRQAQHSVTFPNPFADGGQMQPICIISFSAGVVGAAGAALAWHTLRGRIQVLIAVDGWGVPLVLPFPTYRLSHDEFTHNSCRLIGGGEAGFWADPAVAHRHLWRSPHTVSGLVEHTTHPQQTVPAKTTAAHFIGDCLRCTSRYDSSANLDRPRIDW